METLLKIRNLDKSYGGVHAVNDVSFDVYKGEILGLIGPNGSGKSTCVNLISGVDIQDSGDIIFEGEKLLKQGVATRAHWGIGRTFQSPKPFLEMTVWDSIYTVALLYNRLKNDAKLKTEEIIETMNFSEFVNQPCSKLPIERRKWLDMARVLAINPKLLMLDECLAGLLPREMEESLEMIEKINQSGITVLFIEHVMQAVTRICQRIVVLNEGSVLCEGLPSFVMNHPEVVKAYLGEDYEYVEADKH
jgi:branched-chain amino acid transport system ATP-binding protein